MRHITAAFLVGILFTATVPAFAQGLQDSNSGHSSVGHHSRPSRLHNSKSNRWQGRRTGQDDYGCGYDFAASLGSSFGR